MEWKTRSLRHAAAGERGDAVLQFLLAHEVVFAFVHLHGVAQRARGARDDGDLVHGGGVTLQRRDQGVARLVVGDDELLLVGEDLVLLLVAGDDDLDALLHVALDDLAAALAHGAQRRLVDDVRKLRAGGAGRGPRDGGEVQVRRVADLGRVHAQDVLAALEVRQLHGHAPVKAARAQQRGVQLSGRLVAARMMTPFVVSKPSISVRSWLRVCSRSSLPPMPEAPSRFCRWYRSRR